MKHQRSALRRGYPARPVIGDEFEPPEGWTAEKHECGAACSRCPFSFPELYRGAVGGRTVWLCEGCLRQATGEEE